MIASPIGSLEDRGILQQRFLIVLALSLAVLVLVIDRHVNNTESDLVEVWSVR
ncbi:hypothetical protein [Neorhodopirellula pilleata]|uniref:Uncharacterized protein n=1 Tax=Neorhodopirellula pilleata TaxID=2714738 RepID=A0A5C6A7T8_9BACT|nr:hypothetical protein [Neorhodopirellula pilleata]TWT94363.1 hypothetical protein Pla100_39750 [Neorhodopirellula pilleata]